METWIHNEILDGLTKLLCLSMERTPAADMIAGTAMAWCEALTIDRAWDQHRDTPRIRKAFITMARDRRQWPVPRDFIEALPAADKLLALPSKPADPARAQAAIAEAMAMLKPGRKTEAAGGDA